MSRIIIGNWKMNLNLAEATALAHASVAAAEKNPELDVAIAPSLPWLVPLKEELKHVPKNFHLASQVVSQWPEGAYTGDVTAVQLKGLVEYCLVGHSERRRYHHEASEIIAAQIKQLLDVKIIPVVCFGEMSQSPSKHISSQITLDLRRDLQGLTADEVTQCLFAYEPLWAIGTGHPATPEYGATVVTHVKAWFEEKFKQAPFVLYGGSVTEEDAGSLGHERVLDGLLVGGASLSGKRFKLICERF